MKQRNLIVIHLVTLIVFGLIAYNNYLTPIVYKRVLEHNFEINGVDSKLLEAIIQVESKGNFNAIGKAGEIGGMQIIPKYHLKRCGLSSADELFEPNKNVMCGAEIIRHYLKVTNNNLKEALVMYNGGYRKPKQSYAYADRVLTLFTKL